VHLGGGKLLSEQRRTSLKPKSSSDTTICWVGFVTQQSEEMFCLAVSECRNDRKQPAVFSFFMPIIAGLKIFVAVKVW